MSGTYHLIDNFHAFGLSYEETCERFLLWVICADPFAVGYNENIAEINFWMVMFYGASFFDFLRKK